MGVPTERCGPHNLALACNGRFTEPEDEEACIDDHLVQVSAGYGFASGLTKCTDTDTGSRTG